LLRRVVQNGRLCDPLPSLHDIQGMAARALDSLPDEFHNVRAARRARVDISKELQRTTEELQGAL
jgi:hypothetical protein